MEIKAKKTFLLIDSHALIHRAYHAMPYLQSKSGVPSGALFGLSNMILSAIEKFKPHYIFAANDLPKTTFREMVYEHYKAHRGETEEALVDQIKLAPQIFEAFGIPLLSQEGYEADDVIGTLVKKIQAKEKNYRIVILTGDMDIMQLIDDDKVVVYSGRKGEENLVYHEGEVKKKCNLFPKQIPDYKGLRGDASDNIPGIKGIGEKTATQILLVGESLDNVYKLIKKGKGRDFFGISERMFELLKNGQEDAEFSRELATINCDIDIEIPEEDIYDFSAHIPVLTEVCEEYNFLSLRKKLETIKLGPVELNDYVDFDDLNNKKVKKETKVVVQKEKPENNTAGNIQFSDTGFKKAQIALWLLNSEETNADLSRILFVTKKNNESEVLEYLESELKNKGLWGIYSEMEVPLIEILNDANKVGIKVDREKLQTLLKKYEEEKVILVREIYSLAGHEFNINSPKQLGVILFEELKVQELGNAKMKKTAGGSVSTRADVLEEMRDNHAIVSKILDYREKEKMINTYLEPLLMHSTFDGRIHSTFLQTGAATGRFSSINPNMQNIPVKGEEGVELRKCFVAEDGKVLIASDYSQIELRCAGLLSGDPYLVETYKNQKDIHTNVASKMFHKEATQITKDERNAAKAMNFGIFYGMGVNSIKNTLKVERNVAQAFYDSYTQAMSTLMKYLHDTIAKTKDIGYTETLYGRQRQVKELFSPIPMIRAQGDRIAMNAPIQGTSADIIKFAMVDFAEKCKEKKWSEDDVAFLLQVHDEIIFEVKEELKEEVSRELKEVMEQVLQKHPPKNSYTPIPIVANVKTGKNWGTM